MFKTIVLAVDGSESSDRAVTFAGELARESGGRIVAVHIKELIAGRFAGPVHVDEDDAAGEDPQAGAGSERRRGGRHARDALDA